MRCLLLLSGLAASALAQAPVVNPYPPPLVPGTPTAASTGNNTYCADATGSTTTYTCPSPTPTPTTLSGLLVTFVPQTTNSGSSTLNVAGLGAKTLKQSDCSTNLAASGLTGGSTYLFSYNGTVFCQSAGAGSGAQYVIDGSTSNNFQTSRANLYLEYNFLDGSGTTVTDSSGNARNGTIIGSPTWIAQGGLNVNVASAAGQGVTLPASVSYPTVKTQIVCAGNDGGQNWSGAYDGSYMQGLIGSTNANGFEFTPFSANPGMFALPNTRNNGGSIVTAALQNYSVGTHCYGIVFPGGNDKIYVDGPEVTYSGNVGNTSANFVTGAELGTTQSGLDFRGPIYYYAAYTDIKTSAQMQDILQRALESLKVRGNTITETNQFSRNVMICAGDSIMALICTQSGFNTTFYYSEALGASGTTALQWASWVPTYVNPVYYPLAQRNVVWVDVGTNDMPSYTAATVWANMFTVLREIAQTGQYEVYATTIISRTGTCFDGTCDSEAQAINSLMRANWQSTGISGLIDAASSPVLGCTGCYSNATYFSDGIHPTAAGITIIQNMAKQAINNYVAPAHFGPMPQQVAHAFYSFGTDGGAVSAIVPQLTATIPNKAIIVGATINSTTAVTSGGAATVAIGTSAGSSATSILTATAKTSFTSNAVLNGTVTFAAPVKMTADGQVQLTVGTAALTAGVIEVFVYYVMPQN